ncbi:MAG TPA: IS1182 family transposase, partial [Candidatus Aerophobetes bacterium]|nr:IS1182 family transposase [Candidatus Aerophobetes bacterium]
DKTHPARIFSDMVDQIDITGFQEIKTEGRPMFDTRMMLKVVLWGYANGVRASRKLDERLMADVVYMWLAGLEKPDFRTICLFRKSNLEKMNHLFGEVILLARTLGLIKLGIIAVDGTKVRANVSVESFKSVKDWEKELQKARELAKKILSEAEEADLADDRKYGENSRGDELPEGLKDAKERIKKIEELIKQRKEDKSSQEQKISSTEPESKFMHHKNGSMPAYNGEVAVTKDQIIVHSDVTTEPVDTNQLTPALDSIKETCGKKPKRILADAGYNSGKNCRELEDRKIDGYIPASSEENIGKDMKRDTGLYTKDEFKYDEQKNCYVCPAGEELTVQSRRHLKTKYSDKWITVYGSEGKCLSCQQRQKCIKENNKAGRTITRGEFEAERLRMQQKLKTEKGRKLYRKRKGMVEPVIGQIKVVGNFIRFMLRGLIGAKIEWKWATIAHNLLKITRKMVKGEVKMLVIPS